MAPYISFWLGILNCRPDDVNTKFCLKWIIIYRLFPLMTRIAKMFLVTMIEIGLLSFQLIKQYSLPWFFTLISTNIYSLFSIRYKCTTAHSGRCRHRARTWNHKTMASKPRTICQSHRDHSTAVYHIESYKIHFQSINIGLRWIFNLQIRSCSQSV